MAAWKLFVNNWNCQDLYRSSLDKLKSFYTSLDILNCCQSSIKHRLEKKAFFLFQVLWQQLQILLQKDMTEHVLAIDCIQIQYQRHFVFLTNILDSSFLLEIKAADWQNVGCTTYLLSGRISKTSRNTTLKTHVFSQFYRLLIIVVLFFFLYILLVHFLLT